ncbi:MAG: hypothetical protein JST01_14430 [Cyanobacteria bacterium SZAS TMP-1]|nr:hypothetical protein [Cyanobacteria bacterium SZAS TMP-1]
MIIRVTFKDPDTADDAITDAIKDLEIAHITDPDELEAVKEIRRTKVSEAVHEWLEYGELITVEFDTVARTATVVKP